MKTIFNRRLRLALVPVLGVIIAVVAGSAVSAAGSTGSNAKFVVATTVSISGGSIIDFGSIVPGAATASQPNVLTIQSNDVVGFQVAAVGVAGPSIEQGDQLGLGTCVPNALNTIATSAVNLTPGALAGGVGSAGTAAPAFNLSATSINLWSSAPAMTGAAMTTSVGVILNAPASTRPSSLHCAYFVPFTFTITAL